MFADDNVKDGIHGMDLSILPGFLGGKRTELACVVRTPQATLLNLHQMGHGAHTIAAAFWRAMSYPNKSLLKELMKNAACEN